MHRERFCRDQLSACSIAKEIRIAQWTICSRSIWGRFLILHFKCIAGWLLMCLEWNSKVTIANNAVAKRETLDFPAAFFYDSAGTLHLPVRALVDVMRYQRVLRTIKSSADNPVSEIRHTVHRDTSNRRSFRDVALQWSSSEVLWSRLMPFLSVSYDVQIRRGRKYLVKRPEYTVQLSTVSGTNMWI